MGMKICLAASEGGHLTQLLRLASAWSGEEHFFITPGRPVPQHIRGLARAYGVCKANRRQLLRVLAMALQCLRVLLRERPDVVISTGAAVGCVVCLIARVVMRRRIIWIDSIANVERLSLSGRIVRPFAQLFLVQWPELARTYKGARYEGAVI